MTDLGSRSAGWPPWLQPVPFLQGWQGLCVAHSTAPWVLSTGGSRALEGKSLHSSQRAYSRVAEGAPEEDSSTGRQRQAEGPRSLQGTSMASFPRSQVPSVLGWGLVDDDLDDKVFLNLGFLEPCAVCKQLPREEPSLPGWLNALLAVQLPLELPHCVRQAGTEPHVLACGEAHFQWEFSAHTRDGLRRLQALLLRVLQQQVHRW